MRISCNVIIVIVKSFTLPYPCAKIIINDKVIDVVEVKKLGDNIINMEHGKVFEVNSDRIIVKCVDVLVKLRSRKDGFKFLSSREGGGFTFIRPVIIHKNIA